MKNYFIEELETILDQDKKVTHEKIAQDMEKIFQDEKQFSKLGFPQDASIESAEYCYTPSKITELYS